MTQAAGWAPGPVTLHRKRFFLSALLATVLSGLLWALVGIQPAQVAFGLGLALPGAGFWPWIFDDGGALCLGAPARISYLFAAILTHLLFFGALVFWFAAGNVILPLLVWAVSAAIAGLTAPDLAMVRPLVLLMPIAVWFLVFVLAFVMRPKPLPPALPFPAVARDFPKEIPDGIATRGLMRFTLDRALQPIDAFDGFQFVDQFQTAATRYQITQAGFALALARAHSRDPNECATLDRAMRNLIRKQTDHRIWRYWQWENAWGNFDLNANPVARDNIMYSGFLAAQIAVYARVSGDTQFDAPNAIGLRTPRGDRFDTHQSGLIEALYRGWDNAPFGLMPCEPNWVYPLCNAIGACAAQSHDSPGWLARKDRFRHHLETEFREADRLIVPFRSSHTGLAGPRIGGAVVTAYPVLFWNGLFPDLAAELWGRVRDKTIQGGQLRKRMFWKVDTGDYRFSRAASFAGFAAAAAEMGDAQARDLALEALDMECHADGPVWHRPNASTFAHFTEAMARLNPGGGFARLFAPIDNTPSDQAG